MSHEDSREHLSLEAPAELALNRINEVGGSIKDMGHLLGLDAPVTQPMQPVEYVFQPSADAPSNVLDLDAARRAATASAMMGENMVRGVPADINGGVGATYVQKAA